MNATLLVELLTEELPPKALRALGVAFADTLRERLTAASLVETGPDAAPIQWFASPRRLAVTIPGVRARAPDQDFRQKLMPVSVGLDAQGAATPALAKRLAALGGGLTVADLQRESDGKQDVLFYQGVRSGVALAEGLQAALADAIARLPIPKAMSYQLADGVTTVQFVRPAHGLVALHGTEVVPVTALGLTSGRATFGHRFHSSGPIQIEHADGYARQLAREGKVVPSFDERRERLVALVQAAAGRLGAHAVMPDALVDEVTALTEWPVVYESGFDAEFLAVPPECLILTMQQNQKYFALQDGAGRLLNRFLLVSQIEAKDGGAAIVAGNARVVRARLADAKFFFDQDRRQPLEARILGLAQVVYHQQLGSQLERVERIVGIAVQVARVLGADPTHVERAARLAKADLRTLMVGEFPELQGTMGRYYARHDGEADDVADAIEQHYRPRFAGDALPAGPVATCVALADKIETLTGLFGVGERPTGEKDPYALRRHALGVLRILLELRVPVALRGLLSAGQLVFTGAKGMTDTHAALEAFFFDRLRGLLREQGYSAHEVEAVLAPAPQRIDEIPRLLAAVRAFLALPEGASLAAANKRIGNILKKASAVPADFDPALLFEPAEQELAAAFARLAPLAERHFAAGEAEAGLRALAPLKAPVDRFFDEVMVNVDDAALRANRLALLGRLAATMNRVVDLAQLAAG